MKAVRHACEFSVNTEKGNQYDTSCIHIWNILCEDTQKKTDRQSDKTNIYHQDVCVFFTCKYILICVLGIQSSEKKKTKAEDEHPSKNGTKTLQSDKYVRETS